MKIYNYAFENLDRDVFCGLKGPGDGVLYFDIETTGLARERNQIYLIGCGYYSDESAHGAGLTLNVIQWFAEDKGDEPYIIGAFRDFIGDYSTFINFNGQAFDVPFIAARAKKYNIELGLERFENIDLYTYVKPYKKLLGLNDTKQTTLEKFLKIKRINEFSGGELIEVYKDFTYNLYRGYFDREALDILLQHNMEDVKNMHYLLPLMQFDKLKDLRLSYVNHTIQEYKGYGNSGMSYEILIKCAHNIDLNTDFTSIVNIDGGTYALRFCDKGVTIRIPVKCAALNYYFENYKDYYYLKNEGMCVLKSVAEGVAKENRQNATKENCKVTLDSKFVYAFSDDSISDQDNISLQKKFRAGYNSKHEYIRLDEFEAMPDIARTNYINNLLKLFSL